MSKPFSIQIVERARALIEEREHWCRGALATDASGDTISPISSRAQRRCALGAVIAAAYEVTNDYGNAHDLAVGIVRSIRGASTLVNVNDVRGHAAVLALFDEAIAAHAG